LAAAAPALRPAAGPLRLDGHLDLHQELDGVLPDALLHGLQQRGLRLGGGAVDFVCQEQVSEDWARLEAELSLPILLSQDFCAGDIGWHQVGCKLDPVKFKIQDIGQGAHKEGFCKTRHPYKYTVSP
jgi:hypothetical protein